MIMSGYEQLSMFTMNVDPITATCCMDGCPARASPVEPWMAVGAAIVAAIIVTGQTYPLWFFLIPMIC